ncbi:2-keto-4-pentenoate hydratase [Gimibacter soli]|uniref:2-keto-4-pentenoate hydratase n=1 Tax=Gimibacter soli TaxID=3024400 RepID=A0AAF0BL84_9PROT|nr:2-keto-4-pentenoate hydratase [Gimibacter soli]WCL53837.1 2-keto-4-pentenoate hydratase [Gimibacter soli]
MSHVEERDQFSSIAKAFVDARHAARGLPAYPGAQPDTLAEAYAIQDIAIGLFGGRVGGWKLGRIHPPQSERLGATRLTGPIFTDRIVKAPSVGKLDMSIFPDGFGAAEAEVLLEIGEAPDPARLHWTLDAAKALVKSVRVGIEIASSPLPTINDLGAAVTASDFGNNNGLVLGPEVPNWQRRDLINMPVSFAINGQVIGEASMATMLDGPFGSVRFLLELMARRGRRIEPGTWVSAGAITGVHNVKPGDEVEAVFDSEFRVGCRITAAKAD